MIRMRARFFIIISSLFPLFDMLGWPCENDICRTTYHASCRDFIPFYRAWPRQICRLPLMLMRAGHLRGSAATATMARTDIDVSPRRRHAAQPQVLTRLRRHNASPQRYAHFIAGFRHSDIFAAILMRHFRLCMPASSPHARHSRRHFTIRERLRPIDCTATGRASAPFPDWSPAGHSRRCLTRHSHAPRLDAPRLRSSPSARLISRSRMPDEWP